MLSTSMPPRSELLELPSEILLLILEWLIKIDPVTLFCNVPGVSKRMRSLCLHVHGSFDMGMHGTNDNVALRAITRKITLFPQTTGLKSFAKAPLMILFKANLLTLALAHSLLKEDPGIVNKMASWGGTPLCLACEYGLVEIVRFLMENGADTEKMTRWGGTALCTASKHGHTEIVRILIQNGADTENMTRWGCTPLVTASNKGHTEIVTLLEQAGARE